MISMKRLSFLFSVITALGLLACGDPKPHPNVLSENPAAADSFKRNTSYRLPAGFDLEAHRGGRALFPENTMHGMLSSLKFEDLTTLEMDVVISKDKQVLLSHDPWFSSEICSYPNDDRVLPIDDEKLRLYEMTYEEIKKWDCGQRWNKNFPKQKPRGQYKPLLKDVILAVREYCAEQKHADVNFNIEIKSHPEWDNFMTPPPAEFAKLVYEVVKNSEVKDRILIQSFDVRSLKAMHELDPELKLVLLVENDRDYKKKLAGLDFKPAVYSPHYSLIDKAAVDNLHQMGLKVIPWTVNDSLQMMKTIEMGVDGIISDDPELLQHITREYR